MLKPLGFHWDTERRVWWRSLGDDSGVEKQRICEEMENMLEAHNMALRIKESTVRDDLDGYLSESSEGDDDFW